MGSYLTSCTCFKCPFSGFPSFPILAHLMIKHITCNFLILTCNSLTRVKPEMASVCSRAIPSSWHRAQYLFVECIDRQGRLCYSHFTEVKTRWRRIRVSPSHGQFLTKLSLGAGHVASPTPSCILETGHQAGLWQTPTALVLGTLPAVSTVFPAWTCQAAGTMAGKALVITLFLFICP